MEWVQNISGRPIPDPYSFNAEERRILFDLQRRKHLTEYDDKHKRYPLDEAERRSLERMEAYILHGTMVRWGSRDIPFAPGQVYEVPDGTAKRIVALNPARLRQATWAEVRDMATAPTPIQFQTVQEAKETALLVSSGKDASFHHGPVAIEIEDGLLRYGDGMWQGIPGGRSADA